MPHYVVAQKNAGIFCRRLIAGLIALHKIALRVDPSPPHMAPI
jgi:hypothetical protein